MVGNSASSRRRRNARTNSGRGSDAGQAGLSGSTNFFLLHPLRRHQQLQGVIVVKLNLAPLEFGQVVGLYIATLFVVWQMVTYFTFGTLPTPPILAGGVLIVAGGLIVSFWKTA